MTNESIKATDLATVNPNKFSDRERRIHNFLRQNPVGILSTTTPNGSPHGVVISYTVNEDFSISFLTRAGTQKYNNLTHNNRAALTVHEPASLTTAQINGTTTEIRDSHKISALSIAVFGSSLESTTSGRLPIAQLKAGKYVAFTIQPDQIHLSTFAEPDSDNNGQIFESIESFDLNRD